MAEYLPAMKFAVTVAVASAMGSVAKPALAATAATQPTAFNLRVLDQESGSPIAGVTVPLRPPIDGKDKLFTGSDGTVRINWPANAHWFYMVANDHNTHVAQSIEWNEGEDGTQDHYDIRLPKGTTIGGRVVDEAGKPVAGAVILFEIPGHASAAWPHQHTDIFGVHAKTDATGAWIYKQAPADFDTINVGVSHPDYPNTSRNDFDSMSPFSPISKLRDGTATIVLHRPVAMRVRVVDLKGNPVPKAVVGLTRGQHDFQGTTCVADANGVVAFQATPGRSVMLLAIAPGYAPTRTAAAVPQSDVPTPIELGAPQILTARVIDTAGHPVARAQVLIPLFSGDGQSFNRTFTTDKNGEVTWHAAPTFPVTAVVSRDGYGSQAVKMRAGDKNTVIIRN